VSRRARKRDGVAHVGEAGDVGERALEAEAEAGMRHGAVAAQVAIPVVALLVDAALRWWRGQLITIPGATLCDNGSDYIALVKQFCSHFSKTFY
jgi:hypothetical protein